MILIGLPAVDPSSSTVRCGDAGLWSEIPPLRSYAMNYKAQVGPFLLRRLFGQLTYVMWKSGTKKEKRSKYYTGAGY